MAFRKSQGTVRIQHFAIGFGAYEGNGATQLETPHRAKGAPKLVPLPETDRLHFRAWKWD